MQNSFRFPYGETVACASDFAWIQSSIFLHLACTLSFAACGFLRALGLAWSLRCRFVVVRGGSCVVRMVRVVLLVAFYVVWVRCLVFRNGIGNTPQGWSSILRLVFSWSFSGNPSIGLHLDPGCQARPSFPSPSFLPLHPPFSTVRSSFVGWENRTLVFGTIDGRRTGTKKDRLVSRVVWNVHVFVVVELHVVAANTSSCTSATTW